MKKYLSFSSMRSAQRLFEVIASLLENDDCQRFFARFAAIRLIPNSSAFVAGTVILHQNIHINIVPFKKIITDE